MVAGFWNRSIGTVRLVQMLTSSDTPDPFCCGHAATGHGYCAHAQGPRLPSELHRRYYQRCVCGLVLRDAGRHLYFVSGLMFFLCFQL
jgi:hypothetical protein